MSNGTTGPGYVLPPAPPPTGLGELLSSVPMNGLTYRVRFGVAAAAGSGARSGATSGAVSGRTATLAAARVPYDSALVREGVHDPAGAARTAAELLDSAQPPTAFFSTNNRITVGIVEELWRRGSDAALVGFDDFELLPPHAAPADRHLLRHQGVRPAGGRAAVPADRRGPVVAFDGGAADAARGARPPGLKPVCRRRRSVPPPAVGIDVTPSSVRVGPGQVIDNVIYSA